MLRGREVSSDVVKEFVVTRMADDVDIDLPGTAEVVLTVPHQGMDPMEWLTDPPVEVALSTTHDYLTEVLRVLSGGVVTDQDESDVRISLRVTNRAAFRSRLYELGVRVHVIGPPEVRAEILPTWAPSSDRVADVAIFGQRVSELPELLQALWYHPDGMSIDRPRRRGEPNGRHRYGRRS